MYIDESKKINLDNFHFRNMMADLNDRIEKAVPEIEEKGAAGMKITLNINIELMHGTKVDDNAPTGEREYIMPCVDYKIVQKMEFKDESNGILVGHNEEIIRDIDGNYYLMTAEEASGQLSIFDYEEE